MHATKPCDHCGKEINERLKVCPLCGAHQCDAVEALEPECPRCRRPLAPMEEGGETYEVCGGCGGLWLDRDAFHRSTRESAVYARQIPRESYLPGPIHDDVAYIPCVRCGKVMNRKNFGKISGVIIDECGGHGVWLDAGEIDKIRHFIADGGLERSQNRELERTRTELRDLATRVDSTAFTQKLIHFWNVKRWFFGS